MPGSELYNLIVTDCKLKILRNNTVTNMVNKLNEDLAFLTNLGFCVEIFRGIPYSIDIRITNAHDAFVFTCTVDVISTAPNIEYTHNGHKYNLYTIYSSLSTFISARLTEQQMLDISTGNIPIEVQANINKNIRVIDTETHEISEKN